MQLGDYRLWSLVVARGRISHFPIDLRRRPYNTRTTVRVCDLWSFVSFFYVSSDSETDKTIKIKLFNLSQDYWQKYCRYV